MKKISVVSQLGTHIINYIHILLDFAWVDLPLFCYSLQDNVDLLHYAIAFDERSAIEKHTK